MNFINRIMTFALALFVMVSFLGCSSGMIASKPTVFTKTEVEIINRDTSNVMKIYVVDNPEDTKILRASSIELTEEEMMSDHYKQLCNRMLVTVKDSVVGGVGIAAPQVGLNRRVVAVQRFDKDDAPFEVFPNIYIKEYSKDTIFSPEGCLSVPDKSAIVPRAKWVVILYTDPNTMAVQNDTISGMTAIIFQHEIDHLDGIIYTDRVQNP